MDSAMQIVTLAVVLLLLFQQMGFNAVPSFVQPSNLVRSMLGVTVQASALQSENTNLKSQLEVARKDSEKLAVLKGLGCVPEKQDVFFGFLSYFLVFVAALTIGYWAGDGNKKKELEAELKGMEERDFERRKVDSDRAFERGKEEGKKEYVPTAEYASFLKFKKSRERRNARERSKRPEAVARYRAMKKKGVV